MPAAQLLQVAVPAADVVPGSQLARVILHSLAPSTAPVVSLVAAVVLHVEPPLNARPVVGLDDVFRVHFWSAGQLVGVQAGPLQLTVHDVKQFPITVLEPAMEFGCVADGHAVQVVVPFP